MTSEESEPRTSEESKPRTSGKNDSERTEAESPVSDPTLSTDQTGGSPGGSRDTDSANRSESTVSTSEPAEDDFFRGGTATDGSATLDEQDEARKRLWSGNTRDRSSTRDVGREPRSDPDPDTFTEQLDESDDYARPHELDLDPGTSVLIQCGSQDDRKHAACTDLLGLGDAGRDRNVLLVRYRKLREKRLKRIAKSANRAKIISVGYSQPIPAPVRSAVETVEISNPNDIRRLGIVVSGTIDDWSDVGGETLVCYDSLNVLLKYKDVRSVFRFLHILLGRLDSTDTISHFHVDPLAGNSQDINTLKPLFDEVISIDDDGVH